MSAQPQYAVVFTIDVQRVDGARLSNEENAMVLKMKSATETAIAEIMREHGQQTLASESKMEAY